jgi:hypothetical protein
MTLKKEQIKAYKEFKKNIDTLTGEIGYYFGRDNKKVKESIEKSKKILIDFEKLIDNQ